ncbi:MAG: biopolymer transporter ExbD [Deltaproteobacteria bacterium]|nr:biopolymer transporter ExbD [Deltaproteobacteria bacterium]
MTQSTSTYTGTQNPKQDAMYDATRKRRRSVRKRHGLPEIGDLNITPMLDMMTILLVFLLKNYSVQTSDINVANLVLPHSTTQLEVEEALQLIITKDAILVDQKLVTRLENGDVASSDLAEGPGGFLISPLYEALDARAQHFKQIEKYGGTQFLGRIAIIADQTLPYSVLFRILYTCGRAEFGNFKLFVQRTA